MAEYFKDIFIPLLIYTVTVVFIPVVIYLLLGETLLSTILQCIITLFSALTSGYVIVLNQREKQYKDTTIINGYERYIFEYPDEDIKA